MNDIIERLKTLRLEVNETVVVEPAMQVDLTFYETEHVYVRDYLEKSMAALDDHLHFYLSGNRNKFAKRSEKSDAQFKTMLDTHRRGKNYWFKFSGKQDGASAAEFTIPYYTRPPIPTEGPAFEKLVEFNRTTYGEGPGILYPGPFHISVSFPLDHPLADAGALLDWIKDLSAIQNVEFMSATAGYGLNCYMEAITQDVRETAGAHIAAALARHPGLGIDHVGDSLVRMPRYWPGQARFLPGFLRVQWLTIVSDLMLDELCSGRAKVEAALLAEDQGIVPHDLPGGGLIIQAGPEPVIGDVTIGDHVPAYRAVAKHLAPARVPEVNSYNGPFDTTAANAWLNALETPID